MMSQTINFKMISIVIPIFEASESLKELNLQLNNFLNKNK